MRRNYYRIKQRGEQDAACSVLTAIEDFLASAEVKKLNPRTQNEYRYVLFLFGEWCSEHALSQDKKTHTWAVIKTREKHDSIALHRIDNQVVYCFLEHVQSTHTPSKAGVEALSSHTLALYVKDIKRFLNWCVLDDCYSQHVLAMTVQRIEKPKLEESIKEAFSDAQIEALKRACRKEESLHLQVRDLAIMYLLVDTGIRAQELLTLSIGHVHLETADPHIRVYGKGGKWREIGMGEETRRMLGRYIREFREPTVEFATQNEWKRLPPRQQAQVKRQVLQQERLFVNRTGKPMTNSGLGQLIDRLGEWAGIEGIRCSPHTFRHTFAVNFMRNNDNDIYRLSKLLGHTSVKVTEMYLKSWHQSESRKGVKWSSDQ